MKLNSNWRKRGGRNAIDHSRKRYSADLSLFGLVVPPGCRHPVPMQGYGRVQKIDPTGQSFSNTGRRTGMPGLVSDKAKQSHQGDCAHDKQCGLYQQICGRF